MEGHAVNACMPCDGRSWREAKEREWHSTHTVTKQHDRPATATTTADSIDYLPPQPLKRTRRAHLPLRYCRMVDSFHRSDRI